VQFRPLQKKDWIATRSSFDNQRDVCFHTVKVSAKKSRWDVQTCTIDDVQAFTKMAHVTATIGSAGFFMPEKAIPIHRGRRTGTDVSGSLAGARGGRRSGHHVRPTHQRHICSNREREFVALMSGVRQLANNLLAASS
jgi:hypothetical protein